MDKKTTRRGNYESGSDYVLEYGELRFAFNEEDFAQRVEQAAVKLALRRPGTQRRGARRPPRPRRQRRDRRAQLPPRRAHQRELGGPGRSLQPQPRPLDPPPRLPRRLARPAGQGGRARRRLRRAHPDLRLRPAGPQRRADRALQRAELAPHRLPPLNRRDLRGHEATNSAAPFVRSAPPSKTSPDASIAAGVHSGRHLKTVPICNRSRFPGPVARVRSPGRCCGPLRTGSSKGTLTQPAGSTGRSNSSPPGPVG